MTDYTYVMTGGVDFSGPDKWLLAIFVDTLGDGGLAVSGSGQVQYGQASYFFEMMGSPLIEGTADVTFIQFVGAEMSGGMSIGGVAKDRPGYRYLGTGTVYVGSIGSNDAGNTIHLDFASQWNTAASFDLEFQSSWTIGAQQQYWYRIQGACAPLACPPVAFDVNPDPSPGHSCNKTIWLKNVMAANLTDLCNQLKNSQFIRRIETIHKFSRPANQIAQTAADQACNVLKAVPFCNVPACLDFCIDYDVTVDMGTLAALPIVNSFETSGGVHLGGTAISTGFAQYIDMEGGLGLGGVADYTTQNYGDGDTELPGGPEMGGFADVATENWAGDSFGGADVEGEALVTSSSFSFGGD